MTDEHAPKRARQACRNCRRKKTRCSGEKPACSFCVRLGQPCEYSNESNSVRMSVTNLERSGTGMQSDLAARVAFLESRLGISGSDQDFSPVTSGSGSIEVLHPELNTQTGSMQVHLSGSRSPIRDSDRTSKFTAVPPMPVLRALADVYFTDCYNQPYCYFMEAAFRQRLQAGTLPDYLLLAFAATAARYSTHDFFQGRKEQAVETYAKTAWNIILHQVFSSEQGLDLYAVQATNLLAIIDFTAGQHRLGWVKIGLAVRFAQGLRLNAEPDPTFPLWQQEEYRRVFWSVYILDRFVSCSRSRAPTILDRDCTVRLPSSEEQVGMEISTETPTISVLRELPDIEKCRSLDDFALFVLVSSILGRVVRYSLQQNSSNAFPPWDFRSDFAKIRSILFSFETLLRSEGTLLADSIQNRFSIGARYDRRKVGPYIWSRGVYHLCGCLLHHPFLLHNDLKQYRQTFPQSFARESLHRCHDHAEQLTTILNVVLEKDCCARGSFLGYLAVVASSIHRLYEYSSNLTLKTQSWRASEICLRFLEQLPLYWSNYSKMATALREFDVGETMAKALIEPSATDSDLEPEDMDALWRILDYGWLSDANRTEAPFRLSPSQAAGIQDWHLFEDLMGAGFSMSINQNSEGPHNAYAQPKKQRNGDWWFQLGNGGSAQPTIFSFSP